MRFLLHTSKKARNVNKSVARAATPATASENHLTKSWGQQCSPNCGCVVRFESTMDKHNTIVSASYQAKTILTYTCTENGQRLAHFTTHGTKPLVKECSCNTLHTLSQQVVHFLKGKRIDQVQNSVSGSTSAAVVYACLHTQNLPTRHASCFHLVQQALVGMTCGYLPKASSQQTYQEYLYEKYALYGAVNEKEAYGVDENSGISTGAALHIFDMNNDNGTTVEEEENEQEEEEKAKAPKKLTWETYVDELYHQYDDDETGLEWSA